MKKKTLRFGIGMMAGIYLYGVANNLYAHLGFPDAFISLDWKRILFVGIFGMIFSYLLDRKTIEK